MEGRRTPTSDERHEVEEIQKTLKVSSYLDTVFESLHSGAPPKVNVPNFKTPTRGEVLNAVHSDTPLPHEQEGLNMSFDELYKIGGIDVSPETVVESPTPLTAAPMTPRHTITQNQWIAIKKYPGLVEFLGQGQGEKIARQISEQVNVILAEVIQKNSHEANEHAVACKADRQNLKQYFQTDDWICRVTASGPFRGDEAIFYSRKQDVACVLRRDDEGGAVKYADISPGFNIIFEASEIDQASMEKGDEEVSDITDPN